MSQLFITKARLSFPHLVSPQANREDPTKPATYSADLILPETSPDWIAFMKLCATLLQERFGEEAQVVMNLMQAKTKLRCFGNGNEKTSATTGEVYGGYVGNMFIATKTADYQQPQIINALGQKIDNSNSMLYRELTSQMEAGCYVNAVIKPWVQDNKHGRGIRCELVGLQFAGAGEPLGKPKVDITSFFGAVATTPAAAATPAMGLPPFMMPK